MVSVLGRPYACFCNALPLRVMAAGIFPIITIRKFRQMVLAETNMNGEAYYSWVDMGQELEEEKMQNT